MEVHAHTHTARKKWTHYFWEFFMLFLAVFCGFLAENIREHQVEHKRERMYMVSLLNNLEEDSIMLLSRSIAITKQTAGLDTVMEALRYSLREKKALAYAYVMYLKYGQITINAHFNENTIIQLKNAGEFRIIRKDEVINMLNSYEFTKFIVTKDNKDITTLIMELEKNQANSIFDFTTGAAILKLSEVNPLGLNTDSLINIAINDPLVLIDKNEELIPAFRNNIRSLKSLDNDYGNWVKSCLQKNSELRALIKKEYHLK